MEDVLSKWMGAAAAVEEIFDGATIALAGSGGGLLEPDAVLAQLEQRFLKTGHPRDLTVVHALGIGDGKGSGLGRFAHAGMVRRVIGGHWSWAPAVQRMGQDEGFEAYSFPAGVVFSGGGGNGRRAAGPHYACRVAHLRRPAHRWRQDQPARSRGTGGTDRTGGARISALQAVQGRFRHCARLIGG